ncbi:regulatory protein RecX [Sphingomonas astaxanthinifaciens]|uniref:Regulatory protein RecX n=1 Tax=Sphingomonas astaxanthinifaciens DSM 22298 TaxID=1123267 RepID=A0ABQ5ZAF0_9SPHN|nr:RecX family transcriptional regulator [Sphingomonas astaxanthinifaciens]GLR48657.1 hypothetical protein GCM10007925_23760 [Sphingomonas astaxanthinifaciens DSM 22298]
MGSGDEEREGSGGRRRRAPRPLDPEALRELALAYVARFATSRAKLLTYCRRKLRERGWSGETEPDLDRLVDRIRELGFIDDRAFAGMKTASLLRRGYGRGRVRATLAASGIGEEDGAEALERAETEALAAALRFAERKRIGPYATAPMHDPAAREKAIGAMIRAGHSFDLARRVVAATPSQLNEILTEIDESR